MKVATPLALVVAGEPLMVAVPDVTDRPTDLPVTGPPLLSKRWTVIVEVPVLSAICEVGEAVTVEVPALTIGVVKLTVTV